MPIIINELHTEVSEPEAPDTSEVAGDDTSPATLEPDLATQRALALLIERKARLKDD